MFCARAHSVADKSHHNTAKPVGREPPALVCATVNPLIHLRVGFLRSLFAPLACHLPCKYAPTCVRTASELQEFTTASSRCRELL